MEVTEINGARITPEAIHTIRFLQEEANIDDTVSQINEVIDIILAEDVHESLTSDKECIRIIRNLRYIVQHLSSFKTPSHE